jgi:hypothetical protein
VTRDHYLDEWKFKEDTKTKKISRELGSGYPAGSLVVDDE